MIKILSSKQPFYSYKHKETNLSSVKFFISNLFGIIIFYDIIDNYFILFFLKDTHFLTTTLNVVVRFTRFEICKHTDLCKESCEPSYR